MTQILLALLIIIIIIVVYKTAFIKNDSENMKNGCGCSSEGFYPGRTYYHIPLISPWGTRPNRMGLIHYGDPVGHCQDACSGSANSEKCLGYCKYQHLLS